MSQDLFAAFGGPSSNTRKGHGNLTAGQSFSFFDDINNPSNTPPTKGNNIQQFPLQAAKPSAFRDDPEVQENDDDWGDFEGVSGQAPAPSAAPIANLADVLMMMMNQEQVVHRQALDQAVMHWVVLLVYWVQSSKHKLSNRRQYQSQLQRPGIQMSSLTPK
jgi:hypothetical protein